MKRERKESCFFYLNKQIKYFNFTVKKKINKKGF